MAASFVLKRCILTGSQSGIKLCCSSTPDQHACCRAQLNRAKIHFRKWANSVRSLKKSIVLWNESFTNHTRLVRTGQSGAAATFPVGFVGIYKHKGHDIGLELIRDDKGQRWEFKLAATPAGIKSAVSSCETSGRKIKALRGIIQE